MGAKNSSAKLIEQICEVQRDNRHLTWYDKLSSEDRELTDAVLEQVASQQLAPNTIARKLKEHIDSNVTITTIAKWMRAHVNKQND